VEAHNSYDAAEAAGREEDGATSLVDHKQFKRVLGTFATGVTVATTAHGRDWHGVTANAVMSVSLDPPLVLLSIQAGTRMYVALQGSDSYALNILAATQEAIARYFADSAVPHNRVAFDRFAHHQGITGAPLLDHSLAAIECRIAGRYPAGDHVLYLGQVLHMELGHNVPPLVYFRGAFRLP
jgi:flavin reductase (DIM6/NTAB) family NADH-FMN oxidoreductase RutF